MKNLQEAYTEVMASETLKARFAGIKTQEELLALVRSLGVEATDEEIIAFLQGRASAEGELKDEELLQVAGGKSVNETEVAASIFLLGVGCVIAVVKSKIEGRVGTELKEGMLCSEMPGSN